MELRYQTEDGQPIRKAVVRKLERMLEPLKTSGADVAKAVAGCIKQHFESKWPGSKHFDPKKVTSTGNGQQAVVSIGVPGIGRAYHDIDIYPKNAEWLTIPVHPDAKGKSPTVFDNLFKPKDHNILAANEDGSLVVYYALSKHVHQSQDRSLLPTEKDMLAAAREAASAKLRR